MIDTIFAILNNNKLFNGCATIMLHIGGRYVASEVPKNVEEIFNKKWLRRFFVFCVCFISTRDIKLAILLTLLFIVIFKYLLDNDSRFCLLKNEKQNTNIIDQNKRTVTHEELLRAKQVIDIYNQNLDKQKIRIKNNFM
jgi:hypothetical protein